MFSLNNPPASGDKPQINASPSAGAALISAVGPSSAVGRRERPLDFLSRLSGRNCVTVCNGSTGLVGARQLAGSEPPTAAFRRRIG